MRHAIQNCMTEWSFASGKAYTDPFNEVDLDVVFTQPDGHEHRVPAFWAGDQTWRVRYASPTTGTHRFRTVCSDPDNSDLHGQEGMLEVAPYAGGNPLLQRGPLRVAGDRRHLEHRDGTPFFWLADTWWMGFCARLRWPHDFHFIVADRVAKGFSVIQIVAGLYPDMPYLDPRGANEAGFPWDEGYTRINPAYFDMADLRVGALVDAGLVPCIVACWGYFMPWMGPDRMRKHWRNLVARYGAYPVVWCLAGEGTMPYYLSEQKERDRELQKKAWSELAAFLRETDPYGHPITIHPTDNARNQVEDPSLLDFDMLQTGHGDRMSIPNTIVQVTQAYDRQPRMPVINGEVCYEGICEGSREEVQRFMFWTCMLSGACGHTYGANGIWQVNEEGKPFGPSPHGSSWGDRPWKEASQLPGSGHLGLGKRLLQRYEWWRLEPHPEWVEPHWEPGEYWRPYAAGIPGELCIAFMPAHCPIGRVHLETGTRWRAFFFDPSTGTEIALGDAAPDAQGHWAVPMPPILRDWVLVLDRAR